MGAAFANAGAEFMEYLNLLSHRLHYRIDGDDQAAPWLLFCNSLGADLHMWDAQAAVLSRHFRVLRYDRRGHGRSSAPPPPLPNAGSPRHSAPPKPASSPQCSKALPRRRSRVTPGVAQRWPAPTFERKSSRSPTRFLPSPAMTIRYARHPIWNILPPVRNRAGTCRCVAAISSISKPRRRSTRRFWIFSTTDACRPNVCCSFRTPTCICTRKSAACRR